MNAEKHVIPILFIVVLLAVLVSTYAWFSAVGSSTAKLTISSGDFASIVLTSNGEEVDNSFSMAELGITPYQGQKGFNEENVAFGSAEADYKYSLTYNLEYLMQSTADTILSMRLSKIEIELGSSYAKTLIETISDVFDVDTTAESYDVLNYYSESLNAGPTGQNPSPMYCVYTDNQVTHIVLGSSIVLDYFEFDYWKSTAAGISRGGASYLSAIDTGISLEYLVDCSETGYTNYAGVYVGFYGYDSTSETYCKTFLFSDTIFQNSTFKIYFLVGAN